MTVRNQRVCANSTPKGAAETVTVDSCVVPETIGIWGRI